LLRALPGQSNMSERSGCPEPWFRLEVGVLNLLVTIASTARSMGVPNLGPGLRPRCLVGRRGRRGWFAPGSTLGVDGCPALSVSCTFRLPRRRLGRSGETDVSSGARSCWSLQQRRCCSRAYVSSLVSVLFAS